MKYDLGVSKEEKYVAMSEEQVSQKLKDYINLIVDKKMWYILLDYNLVNINQITGINSTDYDYVNDYFFSKINDILLDYLRVMKKENSNIQQMRDSIERKLAESQKKIKEINEQMESLHFFDRKLKSKLNEEKAIEVKKQVECKDELQRLILKWV